jgi:hypothetical protein
VRRARASQKCRLRRALDDRQVQLGQLGALDLVEPPGDGEAAPLGVEAGQPAAPGLGVCREAGIDDDEIGRRHRAEGRLEGGHRDAALDEIGPQRRALVGRKTGQHQAAAGGGSS